MCPGTSRAHYAPKLKKRTALLRRLKEFRQYQSQPMDRVIELINPVLREIRMLRLTWRSWKRDYGCRNAGHRESGGITTGACWFPRQFSTLP